MFSKETIVKKGLEELMRLLRYTVEEPPFGNTFRNQAFGIIQFLVTLMPDREAEFTVIWNTWQESFENVYKILKNA